PHHIKTETLSNWHTNQNSALSKLCACWAVEANVLKLAFSLTMTENHYKELHEALKSEHEILIQHAQNFATLVNTAISVKEIVHCTFKNMVPHMNRKAIELDLTQRYNTIQALQHLIDS
ncbi:16317_t:CDS:2, partial [Gigaspora margarita]